MGKIGQFIEARNRIPLRYLVVGMVTAALIAVHLVPLYYVSSHKTLSGTVIACIVGLLIVKHLGFLGPLLAFFRRSQKTKE